MTAQAKLLLIAIHRSSLVEEPILLEKLANLLNNKTGQATKDRALLEVLTRDYFQAAKFLIQQGANVNLLAGKLLNDAASKGELTKFKFLLEHGADMSAVMLELPDDINDNSADNYAAILNRLLSRFNADDFLSAKIPYSSLSKIAIAAAGKGLTKVIKFFLDNYKDVEQAYFNPIKSIIAAATGQGYSEILKWMPCESFDLDTRIYGEEVMQAAVENNWLEVLLVWKEKGYTMVHPSDVTAGLIAKEFYQAIVSHLTNRPMLDDLYGNSLQNSDSYDYLTSYGRSHRDEFFIANYLFLAILKQNSNSFLPDEILQLIIDYIPLTKKLTNTTLARKNLANLNKNLGSLESHEINLSEIQHKPSAWLLTKETLTESDIDTFIESSQDEIPLSSKQQLLEEIQEAREYTKIGPGMKYLRCLFLQNPSKPTDKMSSWFWEKFPMVKKSPLSLTLPNNLFAKKPKIKEPIWMDKHIINSENFSIHEDSIAMKYS